MIYYKVISVIQYVYNCITSCDSQPKLNQYSTESFKFVFFILEVEAEYLCGSEEYDAGLRLDELFGFHFV